MGGARPAITAAEGSSSLNYGQGSKTAGSRSLSHTAIRVGSAVIDTVAGSTRKRLAKVQRRATGRTGSRSKTASQLHSAPSPPLPFESGGLFGDDLHAKQVRSLAGAALGAIQSASLAFGLIRQGLTLERGRLTRHAWSNRWIGNQESTLYELLPNMTEFLP